jgi:hypothetical protein
MYISSHDEMYLQHYGVLGMKWGVRRNASKAYSKALQKKKRLEDKSAKLSVKASKKQLAATKKMSKATSMDDMKKGLKVQVKANKLNKKAAKYQQKGRKWVKKMDKTFADYEITRVPASTTANGRKLTESYVVKKVND